MRIVNLNPDSAIGASGWFVELEGNRILMDAGIHPRREGREALPLFSAIAQEEVDAIAISHCHHDHVGSLPVAVRYFPHAHVLMSELSYFLVERVLHNSVNVMKRQRDELGIRDYPLFSHNEVEDIAHLFQGFRRFDPGIGALRCGNKPAAEDEVSRIPSFFFEKAPEPLHRLGRVADW